MDALIIKTGQNLLLPFYHVVSDNNPKHVKHLYTPRSIHNFKKDLDFLLEHFKSISLDHLLSFKKDGIPSHKRYFHLTFDDGMSEFYTIVAPILREKGVHATVFLNSNFIDNKELFYRFKASILYDKLKDNKLLKVSYQAKEQLNELANKHGINFDQYLQQQQPYLTSAQIKELQEQGFTFGAHSKNHPLYKDIELDAQVIQTKDSIASITKAFNLDYAVFSFPFTDDGVKLAFFDAINSDVDFTFGCAGLKEDNAPNHFQRIGMEANKSGKEIIKSEYLYYLMKEKVGKHKIMRR